MHHLNCAIQPPDLLRNPEQGLALLVRNRRAAQAGGEGVRDQRHIGAGGNQVGQQGGHQPVVLGDERRINQSKGLIHG